MSPEEQLLFYVYLIIGFGTLLVFADSIERVLRNWTKALRLRMEKSRQIEVLLRRLNLK